MFKSVQMQAQAQTQKQQAPKKPQKPRRRVATMAQRRAANIRERRRMFNLNSAFDRLRKKVPSFAYEKRLSRIETLKLAIMYIKFMDDLVNDDAYAEKYKQLTANTSAAAASSGFLSSGAYLSLYGHCNPSSSSSTTTPSPLTNLDAVHHQQQRSLSLRPANAAANSQSLLLAPPSESHLIDGHKVKMSSETISLKQEAEHVVAMEPRMGQMQARANQGNVCWSNSGAGRQESQTNGRQSLVECSQYRAKSLEAASPAVACCSSPGSASISAATISPSSSSSSSSSSPSSSSVSSRSSASAGVVPDSSMSPGSSGPFNQPSQCQPHSSSSANPHHSPHRLGSSVYYSSRHNPEPQAAYCYPNSTSAEPLPYTAEAHPMHAPMAPYYGGQPLPVPPHTPHHHHHHHHHPSVSGDPYSQQQQMKTCLEQAHGSSFVGSSPLQFAGPHQQLATGRSASQSLDPMGHHNNFGYPHQAAGQQQQQQQHQQQHQLPAGYSLHSLEAR